MKHALPPWIKETTDHMIYIGPPAEPGTGKKLSEIVFSVVHGHQLPSAQARMIANVDFIINCVNNSK